MRESAHVNKDSCATTEVFRTTLFELFMKNVHLFVRKFEQVEGITQPFIYLGKVFTLPKTAEGNKPIKMIFALQNEVSEELYNELTTVVE